MMDLSISQLEKLIEDQKSRVRDLNTKRKSLIEQIGEVELEISNLTGRKKRRKRRKRRTTKVSKKEIGHARAAVVHRGKRLIDYVVSSLENSPATLDRLAEDVVDAGYKSRAKNLTGSIYNAIYEHRKEGNDNVQYHRDTKIYSARSVEAQADQADPVQADEVQADEIAGGGYGL